jgi:hypothetical protein
MSRKFLILSGLTELSWILSYSYRSVNVGCVNCRRYSSGAAFPLLMQKLHAKCMSAYFSFKNVNGMFAVTLNRIMNYQFDRAWLQSLLLVSRTSFDHVHNCSRKHMRSKSDPCFPTEILYPFLISPVLHTRPSQLIWWLHQRKSRHSEERNHHHHHQWRYSPESGLGLPYGLRCGLLAPRSTWF